MFEAIVTKLSNLIRTTVRAIGRRSWLAPAAILTLFLVL
jgi:hypothetical protein